MSDFRDGVTRLRVIDSHTGGEPTRLIVAGGPDLGGGSMGDQLDVLRLRHDRYRTALCTEPRGSDVMVGGLLCDPLDPQAAAGVIFFNNTGYLGMCGHGTIGLIETLKYLGRVGLGLHKIETPAGTVAATLREDGLVSFENVPCYRHAKDVEVDVPGLGRVVGDVAYGGNWFFLFADHGQQIHPNRTADLARYSAAVMDALDAANIRGAGGAKIDHVELFGPPSDPSIADSMSFVLCPGGAYDRSPCGTGTSAKLACLAADGKLAPGQTWRQQSVIGSIFEASYRAADAARVVPTVAGRAFVTADVTVVIDSQDPFAFGLNAKSQ